MFLNIAILFFYFTSYVNSATNFCLNKSPCKCILAAGQVIDLSGVGYIDHPRFFEIKSNDTNDEKLYSYNPCYEFDSSDSYTITKKGNKACKKAAACVRSPGWSNGTLPEEHAIGIQSLGKFGSSEGLGLHINYTVPSAKQRLSVMLICSNETSRLVVQTPEADNNKNVVMTLYSKCACENGCVSKDPVTADEGMSTGSKLLIAFFTILLAYFLIGIIWNFCNGAQGLELVPNYEFWNELPKLIIEGLIFTCSCFGKKSTYGEV